VSRLPPGWAVHNRAPRLDRPAAPASTTVAPAKKARMPKRGATKGSGTHKLAEVVVALVLKQAAETYLQGLEIRERAHKAELEALSCVRETEMRNATARREREAAIAAARRAAAAARVAARHAEAAVHRAAEAGGWGVDIDRLVFALLLVVLLLAILNTLYPGGAL